MEARKRVTVRCAERINAGPPFQDQSIAHTAGLLPTNDLTTSNRSHIMLWTILVVLLVLWALGFSFHVLGGLIHLLLVVALVVLVLQLLTGRRVP